MQARTYPTATPALPSTAFRFNDGWFRRWWPVLAPAGFSLVCAVVLAVQQQEIRGLKQALAAAASPLAEGPVEAALTAVATNDMPVPDQADEAQEIARLKDQVAQLKREIADLEKLRTFNEDLRSRLASTQQQLSAEDMDDVAAARARAKMIMCVNNMKQLGLSARIWSGDNQNRYPTDILSMSNEMNNPKILVCPADKGRAAALNFGSFNPAGNNSYEWFLDPPSSDAEPSRVLLRCPIHGNVGLCDGSVQMGAATNHPDWFIQRDGKLYFESPAKQ